MIRILDETLSNVQQLTKYANSTWSWAFSKIVRIWAYHALPRSLPWPTFQFISKSNMVSSLNKMLEKPNPLRSLKCLRNNHMWSPRRDTRIVVIT